MMMAGMDMFGSKVLVVGDRLEREAGHSPLFIRGNSRWYALMVAPQREDQVEDWLRARGVYGFHPVLRRITRCRGIERAYDRRYVPGYVFARFKGEPLPHEVLSCPWISGVLSHSSGAWGVLHPRSMAGLHAMRKIDTQGRVDRAAVRVRGAADRRLKSGDRALFKSGSFTGFECEVVNLKADGGLSVKIQLFGRDVLMEGNEIDFLPV